LSSIFAGQRSQFAAGEEAVNALALLAMTEVFPPDQRLPVPDCSIPATGALRPATIGLAEVLIVRAEGTY
jgi:hypothetical protein